MHICVFSEHHLGVTVTVVTQVPSKEFKLIHYIYKQYKQFKQTAKGNMYYKELIAWKKIHSTNSITIDAAFLVILKGHGIKMWKFHT